MIKTGHPWKDLSYAVIIYALDDAEKGMADAIDFFHRGDYVPFCACADIEPDEVYCEFENRIARTAKH